MRKRTLGAVLVAGLIASGAGAFTASNTVPNSVAGYGAADVTGATVTNIDYTLDATDADRSKVSAIVFTANGDMSSHTSIMTIDLAGTVVTAATSTCAGVYTALTTSTAITCTFGTAQELAAFDGLSLTVHQ